MLVSRLNFNGAIDVIGLDTADQLAAALAKPVRESAAVAAAASQKADYVSIGSIEISDQAVHTSAKLIRTSDGKTLVTFDQTGKTQGEILPHIKLYAIEIRKALGQNVQAETASPVQTAQQKQPAVDESRRHPDTLWTGSISSGSEPMKVLASDGKTPATVWKSLKFNSEIKSLAIGDVTGSKKNELVFINGNAISLYRLEAGKLQMIDEFPGNKYDSPFRVDVADINQDGHAQIFVTSLHEDKTQLNSYVLEWNGSNLDQISTNQAWYFRIMTSPKTGTILAGQRRNLNSIFIKGIHQIAWQNGTYQESASLPAPSVSSIYAFSRGDALNNGSEVTLSITSSSKLRAIDETGDTDWTSVERFTAGSFYLPYPPERDENSRIAENVTDKYFLPQRIFITDIDHDGKNEVLLINNKDLTGKYIPNLRIFKNGHIECLEWVDGAFAVKWKTTDMSGQISDMAIGDLNNDGQNQIVFSQVESIRTAFTSGKSYIVVWEPGSNK